MSSYSSDSTPVASTSTAPIPDPGPTRRQNTACDACRQRKVKCNKLPGDERCQHCISKNYPCTHHMQQATAGRKRAPGQAKRPTNGVSSLDGPKLSPHSMTRSNDWPSVYSFPLHQYSTPSEVLAYMFSPPENGSYQNWGSLAHRLEDEKFRAELFWDLFEVFFTIVSVRMPLLEQAKVKSQIHFGTQAVHGKPIHAALFATIVAWGCKFSENTLFLEDRSINDDRSAIAHTTMRRARIVAEALGIHRVASQDHVIIALLIEPLQSQIHGDPEGYRGFWISTAARHLIDLKYNHKRNLVNIQDLSERGTMIFAWWMAVLGDSYGSAYYRRKPVLDDDDYDVDMYLSEPIDPNGVIPSSREKLEVIGYYEAAHSLAYIARFISRHLWKPRTASQGLPFEILEQICSELDQWKTRFLHRVGVPPAFQAQDFVSAVSACASDATYHVMWIILFNGLDEFGVRELRQSADKVEQDRSEILMRRVYGEGISASLRIAGLASLLTSHTYLKLDPAVMNAQIVHAGTFLAKLGRPECFGCIEGMEQYSYSYDEAGGQAMTMRNTYNIASGAVEGSMLGYMKSISRAVSRQNGHHIPVDHIPPYP